MAIWGVLGTAIWGVMGTAISGEVCMAIWDVLGMAIWGMWWDASVGVQHARLIAAAESRPRPPLPPSSPASQRSPACLRVDERACARTSTPVRGRAGLYIDCMSRESREVAACKCAPALESQEVAACQAKHRLHVSGEPRSSCM
eukprot:365969-Chlamydomonas_euryale.AAC.17